MKTTAEELRAEAESKGRDAAGHKLHLDGVNWDKLAAAINDDTTIVPGWEAPRVLPPLWHEPLTARRGVDGTALYDCTSMNLRAILSCSIQSDGKPWLHLSVSHRNRIPRWHELGFAKETFLGDREAYQVLPPKAQYVNVNEKVLHLFALLDEKAPAALPDFTFGTGSL